MAKVTFGNLTATQLQTRVTNSTIVVGRIYTVTNGSIISIVKGKTVNSYDILYMDAIASKPVFNAKGHELTYLDASGVTKVIDLKSMTVGDRTDSGNLPLSNIPTGVYRGKIGNAASGAEYTSLPTTGVSIDDYFLVVTAATYNTIVCSVNDVLRVTSISPASYEKDTTVEAPGGLIKNSDTLAKAFARIQNRLGDHDNSLGNKVDQSYADLHYMPLASETPVPLDANVEMQTGRTLKLYADPATNMEAATKQYVDNKVAKMFNFKGTIGASLAALPSAGVQVNDYYVVVTNGTYGGIVSVVRDMIRATATTPTWAKLTNKGTVGTNGTVTSLPSSGVAINDCYTVVTNGTYGSIACVVGDVIVATAATPTWAKMTLRGTVGTVGDVTALPTANVVVGDSYRVIVSGTFAGEFCQSGDMVIATANTPVWTVLQVNIDTASFVTGVGASMQFTQTEAGKIADLLDIVQSDATSNASPSFGGTVTMVDSITRDGKGRVTGRNLKTVTLPSETPVSMAANAAAAYKVLSNASVSGHAITPTYTDVLALLMTGWATDANVGNIVVGDSLKGALNRLQNRIGAAETRLGNVESNQDWIEG